VASSTHQARVSSKQLGEGVAADVLQLFDELEGVEDTEATWHDAVLIDHLWPGDPSRLRFGGICVACEGHPVEIKAALVRRSNGDRDSPGHWYIKRQAHERMLDAAGHYLLVVYQQRGGRRHLARIIVPAATMDDLLRSKWYEVNGDRSENEVAQLSWPTLLDEAVLRRENA